MILSEHLQAIIKASQSFVLSRNYPELEPIHVMLALFLDENDMPKILLERVGLGGDFKEKFNTYVRKFPYISRGQFTPVKYSSAAINLLKIADREAEALESKETDIEHMFLALFKINNPKLDTFFAEYHVSKSVLYDKMLDEVRRILVIDDEGNETLKHGGQGILNNNENSNNTATSQTAQETPKEALEKYTIELTARAKDSKLDPVIGRDDEIRRTIQILNRRSKNNPVIIGEPGVGKTAIIEGLAQRIISGDVPESLKNDKIFALDIGALLAGASYRGQFEERFKNVLKAIEENTDDYMLFIDEIHSIMGTGSADGSADAGNLLKPMLARGSIRVLGATTIDEYRKYIEKDKALERRFQPVIADEPSIETTISILRGLKEKYEGFHCVKITDSAITDAVTLSHRYISDRCLPDKAIDLIDEAASALRIEIDTMPEEIDVFIREKIQLEMNRKALEKETSAESKKKLEKITKKISDLEEKIAKLKNQWLQEKKVIESSAAVKRNIEKIKSQIEQFKKNPTMTAALEAKYSQMLEMQEKLKTIRTGQSKKCLLKEQIDGDDIAEIVAKWTGIPINRLQEDESRKLIGMEEIMHKRVVGQAEAVTKISNAIRLARSGLKDPKRPIGTFLFLGPTGVGKTELGKTLAEILFNDEDALIRIDMSEFMEKHNISRLTGSTAGFVGYEEGGQLTEAVRRKPYSVVLFDEVEKAHPDIFNIMLQMFDDGRLTDGQGRLVDFKNTVLIMTSNLGSNIILDENLSEEEKYQGLTRALREKFKPEFLNRIDETIMFKALTCEELQQIVDIQSVSLKKRLAEQDIELTITDSAKEFLAKEGYEPLYGARPLRRVIRNNIEIPLSTKILAHEFSKGDKISAICENNSIVFVKK
ncbi:AAA family ATPase [bacterium]|nr:AAA family ATPase [bacterium]